jgi:hypothetical protein
LNLGEIIPLNYKGHIERIIVKNLMMSESPQEVIFMQWEQELHIINELTIAHVVLGFAYDIWISMNVSNIAVWRPSA